MLSGEALLIVEGEERPLRQWDFFHCPAGTKPHHRRRRQTRPALFWPSARVSTRQARAGAVIRWTKRRSGTAQVSKRKRPMQRRRTRVSEVPTEPVSAGLASRIAPRGPSSAGRARPPARGGDRNREILNREAGRVEDRDLVGRTATLGVAREHVAELGHVFAPDRARRRRRRRARRRGSPAPTRRRRSARAGSPRPRSPPSRARRRPSG